MSNKQDAIDIFAYAPALRSNDRRPLAIVHGMERALPELRLGWTVSDEGQRIALPDRDAWVLQERMDGGFPLLRNGDDGQRVTLTAWENPRGLAAGSPPHLEVHAVLPESVVSVASAPGVLEAIAEGSRAFWGHATPFNAGVDISQQTTHPLRKPGTPPRGLPALRFPEHIPSPEVPHRLGWLNYWSAATARTLGFPAPVGDAELLSQARRTLTGGWVVQLTETPLDLDDPSHLEALLHAYARFPAIGGRAVP
ncbi:MAG: hypothetical protein EOO71_13575 [Myxococcaceae bacterium]|nr:MAG: hypothetical protein EOO71_13575 [Myxococcaceae bacterium]